MTETRIDPAQPSRLEKKNMIERGVTPGPGSVNPPRGHEAPGGVVY